MPDGLQHRLADRPTREQIVAEVDRLKEVIRAPMRGQPAPVGAGFAALFVMPSCGTINSGWSRMPNCGVVQQSWRPA